MDALPVEPKQRPIPKRVREAISEIVEGRARTITAAAKKVGLSRERLSRALSEPHIAEHLRQKAARQVAISAGRASARLMKLIDSPSHHVSLDAARFSLGVAGIKPTNEAQVAVSIDIKAGYVIDLSGRRPTRPGDVVAGDAESAVLPAPAASLPPSPRDSVYEK